VCYDGKMQDEKSLQEILDEISKLREQKEAIAKIMRDVSTGGSRPLISELGIINDMIAKLVQKHHKLLETHPHDMLAIAAEDQTILTMSMQLPKAIIPLNRFQEQVYEYFLVKWDELLTEGFTEREARAFIGMNGEINRDGDTVSVDWPNIK